MFNDAFWEYGENEVNIRYRTDGNLFNLWKSKLSTKMNKSTIMFVHDCALTINSEEDK
uniref:Uncharacterized protein n=1 Tax=Arion vulgaris TaxID=1028688 RepID=A0A0B7BKP4_9EUPU